MFHKFIFILIFSLSSLYSYSFTCLPPLAVKNSLAVNPVLFIEDKNSGGMETFIYYGMTDKADVNVSILTVNGVSNFSAMYRHSCGESFNYGLRANASWLSPSLYFGWEDDQFIIQATASTQFTYDYMEAPAIYGVFCPGIKFSEKMNFCCDFNPGYYMKEGDYANCAPRSEGFDIDIVPSFGFQIEECTFSMAMPIYNTLHDVIFTFGMWVYFNIK
jgi:hypothetical protein